MKILMVLTSHDQLGETGKKTGLWLEEFATPYFVFRDAGAELTLASPLGGQPPIDPKSEQPDAITESTLRFQEDESAQAAFAQTKKLSEVSFQAFDGVFYPGGHGPLWDLYVDAHSIALIESFYHAEKPVAAVCHAPAVLLQAKRRDGQPLVQGKTVTGFSNTEEEAVELTNVVPFLLEDELAKAGGQYSKTENWQPYCQVDGLLITGQNPASSALVAQALIEKLQS